MGEIIRGGLYSHYKGNLYTVLHVGRDSNNHANREDVVIYMSLSPPHAGSIHTRWVSEFCEDVEWIDGELYPRFNFVTAPPMGSNPQ